MSDVEDGAIVAWGGFVEREEEMSAGTATRFGFTEVTGIAMDGEFHVAAFVCENGILLCSKIVEELTCMLKGVSSWRGGLGGDGAEWDKQSTVNSSAVEQKFSTNLLDELFSMAVEEGRSRRCLRILLRSSILYRRVWVRLILAASCAVPKDGEGFLDVPWHEEVNNACVVVPAEVNADVTFPSPIGCDLVVVAKDLVKVFGVFAADIFDSEIVNGENKLYGPGPVTPEAGDILALEVAMLVKSFFE